MSGSNLGMFQIAINTASLADGSTIAAYLTSASGALVTSTTIGGKVYADSKTPADFLSGTAYASGTDYLSAAGVVNNAGNWVPFTLNAAGELPVAATINFAGDYAEDSAHVSGDIGLFTLLVRQDTLAPSTSTDGDYGAFKSNNNGELYTFDTTTHTTLTAILADTATIDSQTLTIQNTLTALSKAEDSVHASGDQGIQALAVRKDSQGSNAADGDYTSLQTWSEGSVKVVDVRNGTILQQQVSVTDTAAAVPAAALANRKTLMLQNTGANRLWIGSATVTTSGATAGIEMPANSFMELEVGPAVSVYAVKNGAAGNNLNVLELA